MICFKTCCLCYLLFRYLQKKKIMKTVYDWGGNKLFIGSYTDCTAFVLRVKEINPLTFLVIL